MHKNKPTPKMRPLTTGIISTFLLTSSAFSSDDLPLTVAHRPVLHAIELQSSTSPDNSSSLTRKLSHADSNDSSSTSCSICYDGNDPYHPDRRLELYIDDVVGSPDDSGQLSTSQDLLTCMDYESTFLTKLFPEDSSCRAFQGSVADICGCARPSSVCTLCEFGAAPPRPDAMIPAGLVGNSEPISCLDFDKSFKSVLAPSLFFENVVKCDVIRSIGKTHCGCPEPCQLCREGHRIGNPTHPVRDVQNLLDSVVGPFEEDEGGPTCRDVSNAALTASTLFIVSAGTSSDLDYGIDLETAKQVNEEYICDLYRSAFALDCECIRVSNPKLSRHGCNLCENNDYANPTQSVQVLVDGFDIGTTCANVDAFALLGFDICSKITEKECPCAGATTSTPNNALVPETTLSQSASTGNATPKFDAVGVSLAVSTMIVIVASIL